MQLSKYLLLRKNACRSATEFDESRIRGTLTDVQRVAINRFILDLNGRGMLTAEMGMGKTLMCIAMIIHYGGSWLIAILSMKGSDWVHECLKWAGIKAIVINSTKDIPPKNDGAKVYIISHTLGRMNPDFLLKQKWDGIVIDEAHVIKGAESQVSRAWMDAMHLVKYAVLVTGTPLMNGTMDVFNLLNGICPLVFHDRKAFSVRYAGGRVGPDGKWQETHATNVEELSELLSHFMARNAIPKELEDKPESESLNRILYTFRVPGTVDLPQRRPNGGKEETQRIWRLTNALKQPFIYEFVIGKIRELPLGQSAAVFFHHDHIAKKFRQQLDLEKIEHVYVNGNVPKNKRAAILDPVKHGRIPCAVVTTCCSTAIEFQPGVTLIIIMELPWSPSTIHQAEARANRKGQSHTVTSIWMYAENTADKASTEAIESSMAGLINNRAKLDTSIPVMSRSYGDRYDLARLAQELPLIILGMMSSEFSPNIEKICDVIQTDVNKFTVQSLTFEPSLPGPVPTGATARQIRTSVKSAQYQNERVGLGFKINYDIMHLPEGAQMFTNNMLFLAGAYVKMAEFGMLERLLETQRNKLDANSLAVMEYNEYQNSVVTRRDLTAIAHKTSRGMSAMLQKIRLDAEYVLGGGRKFTVGIWPMDKPILVSNSQQNADYNLAGQDAQKNLHGFREIQTLNGITFYEPPTLPNKRFSYSRMGIRMVNGAVHVYSRQPEYSPTDRSIGLYDITADRFVRISEEQMLAGVPFYGKFDANKHAWEFKVFFILVAFPIVDGCGLASDQQRTAFQTLKTYLRSHGGTRVVQSVDPLYHYLVEKTKMPAVEGRMRGTGDGYVQTNSNGTVAAAAVAGNDTLDGDIIGRLTALSLSPGSPSISVHGKQISHADLVGKKTELEAFQDGRMRYQPADEVLADGVFSDHFNALRKVIHPLYSETGSDAASQTASQTERTRFIALQNVYQTIFNARNSNPNIRVSDKKVSPVNIISGLIEAIANGESGENDVRSILHGVIIAIAVWQMKFDGDFLAMLGFVETGTYYTHPFLDEGTPRELSYTLKDANTGKSDRTTCRGSYVIKSETITPSSPDIRLPSGEFTGTVKLVTAGKFDDPRLFFPEIAFLGKTHENLLPDGAVEPGNIPQTVCAIQLVKKMYGAIGDAMWPLLFRTSFNGSLDLSAHSLMNWLNVKDRAELEKPVYFLEMKTAILHMDKGEKETFFTDENRDFKLDVMAYTPDTFHLKNSVALMRPCDTGTYTRVILMSPGKNVAAITLSPPLFTEGMDAPTQMGSLTCTAYYGAHLFDEDAVHIINGMMYDTLGGGYNATMHTLQSAISFAEHKQFRITSLLDPSIWVVPIPKNKPMMPISSFMHTTGRPPLDVCRGMPEEYPHADFWSRLYRFNTATSDLHDQHPDGRSVIAMQLFPCAYEYTNTAGMIVREEGNTCHGTHSEGTGMQAIRRTGLSQYPHRMD